MAASTLLGERRHVLGQPLREVLPFLGPAGESAREGQVYLGAVTSASGQRLDLEVRCTAIPGDDPEQAALLIVHDVSHLAELNRLREQLLYNVAHELRGPLTVLDNALEILSTDYGELNAEAFGQLVRGATRTAARLRQLMEDLLSAGSIQNGRFQIHRRRLPLTSIVSDAIEAAEPEARERLQHIASQVPEERLTVLADRTYASRVLLNLLSNAIKYSPEGATIQVRAGRSGTVVRIAVQDSGPGISAEQQAGMFERFYRVRDRAEAPGVGLGLAIARGIVEAHGGSIGVESALGHGTMVWFTLPLAPPPTEQRIADEW
jgi:signal transduction histidine kinase